MLVTGPPGAGKTTIAEAIRVRTGLPLLAKDELKETLGGALGITEREESHRLGGAVFELLALLVRELLRSGASVIAEGNFTQRSLIVADLPPARIVQVHVTAPPHLLRSRLLERAAGRHPVHYDQDAADEIAARAAAGEWVALVVEGELIELDTTEWPDLEALFPHLLPG